MMHLHHRAGHAHWQVPTLRLQVKTPTHNARSSHSVNLGLGGKNVCSLIARASEDDLDSQLEQTQKVRARIKPKRL